MEESAEESMERKGRGRAGKKSREEGEGEREIGGKTKTKKKQIFSAETTEDTFGILRFICAVSCL